MPPIHAHSYDAERFPDLRKKGLANYQVVRQKAVLLLVKIIEFDMLSIRMLGVLSLRHLIELT